MSFSNPAVNVESLSPGTGVHIFKLLYKSLSIKIDLIRKNMKNCRIMIDRNRRYSIEIKENEKIRRYNEELMRVKNQYLRKIYHFRKQRKILQKKIFRLNNIIKNKRDAHPLETIPESF